MPPYHTTRVGMVYIQEIPPIPHPVLPGYTTVLSPPVPAVRSAWVVLLEQRRSPGSTLRIVRVLRRIETINLPKV